MASTSAPSRSAGGRPVTPASLIASPSQRDASPSRGARFAQSLVRKSADRASMIFQTQKAIAESAAGSTLNFEEIHAFHARMCEVQLNDEEWLASHPEVRSILQDFTAAVLADKPADVKAYARDHFARYYAATAATASLVADLPPAARR